VEQRWLAAAHAGDRDAVLGLLDTWPGAAEGEDGSELLRAAALGRRAAMVQLLVERGADPARPWDGDTDPVSWAADRGACEVLKALLARSDQPYRLDSPQHRALKVARAWLDLDPERELRRRIDVGRHGQAVVERTPVGGSEHEPSATLIRVTAPDGRYAEVETAHRGIVTYLERSVGIRASRDELAARALHFAVPGSCDWTESLDALTSRMDLRPIFTWAAEWLDDPSVDVRRFAVDVLHYMSFDERPFATQAVEVLRERLRVEPDPVALESAIGAFAWYSRDDADLMEVMRHARHPDPQVRWRVAALGGTGRTQPVAPEVSAVLAALTSDDNARVRAIARQMLADARR
jgi:hypothetical protein